jgi:hypothetical protein
MWLKNSFSRLVSTRFRFTDSKTGELIICELEIAHPLPLNEDAVCGYRLVPLKMEWMPIYGVDSYQALKLVFQLVDPLLDSYRSEYEIEPWFEEP